MDTQTPLEQIEEAARFYADARAELQTEVDRLNSAIKAIQMQHRSPLIALLDQAANARVGLESILKENPSQFEKPKTRQIHGIKCGFRKLPGRIEYADDEAKLIVRIREQLRGKAKQLIQTKETISKEQLAKLSAAELASIGASLIDCGDEVVIKAIDTDLDRLIKSLTADEDFARDLLSQDRVL